MTPAGPPAPLFTPGDVLTIAAVLVVGTCLWAFLHAHLVLVVLP